MGNEVKRFRGSSLPDMKKETQLNVSHSNKFNITFSDIPRINQDVVIDPSLFEDFVISVEYLPISIETIPSYFLRQVRHHPADKGNGTLDSLQITFKSTEYKENYLIMRKIIWDILNGDKPDNISNLVDYNFDFINIEMLDNNKRVVNKTFHKDCLPTNVSGLNLTHQDSEELEFTVTFILHDFDISLGSIYD